MKKSRPPTRQRGISLIESIATLGIMSAVAVGTVMMSSQYTEDTRTASSAEHLKTIAEAAQAYVRDNRASILDQAGAASPVQLSVPMLIATGHLPSGYSATNSYRQTVCALVIEPTAGALNTLVVAEGGDALDDVSLAHFASLMGAPGGGRFASAPTVIQGAGGAWSMPIATFDNLTNNAGQRCDGSAGNVQIAAGTPVYAQWMSATDTADPGFLSRDVVPGNPGANTMQTHINMGGNRISNLGFYLSGASCPAGTLDGDLSRGSRGEVLSCVGGKWERQGQAYWGTSVGTFSALPACLASNLGETRKIDDITGVYTCDGLRWTPSLNDASGLALPAHLTVAGNASIAGAATVSGRLTTNEFLEVKGLATEGDVCPKDGVVGRDVNYRLLSCQSGYWMPSSRAPRSYRYIFESSQKWTVPAGVKSAYVTMAGGGGSGVGWRLSNAIFTGHSGGYVFSHPVNFVDGETLDIIVGGGGRGYGPYRTGIPANYGPPYYVYDRPFGDDGLGGYPGESSKVISPSNGTLLECAGGSGVSIGGVDAYNGTKVAGNLNGATTGSGMPAHPAPSRNAVGPYANYNGPGKCGSGSYGIGNIGMHTYSVSSGTYTGGATPFGYGSGGSIHVSGCYVTTTHVGTCIWSDYGRSGVVIIDVSY